ncbi:MULTISPECIES: response regulator [Legionella]|uniref:Response regulator n=1 Tax=Legionella resiliens TaxID=2905958 RepID=A0ABS8X7D2_9GAMM|nr:MULTISPECIES: response regulator [unclassified Legionella]MCE0724508.1 response regulator [Legionella sp. 9fVS26]MCE3533661.1 response regulator [Legionella sp. 8cVS16]QLZ69852.1 response regulator [Legionella sp. PC1000]
MYSTKPILLIEDDQIDQMAIQRALAELKITNELAIRENGEDALIYLKEIGRPCLIILDLNMPRMNGLEFLDIIKRDKLFKFIPVVVFTTSQQIEDKIRAYEKCIAGYIAKPADSKKIIEILKLINDYWTISEGPLS